MPGLRVVERRARSRHGAILRGRVEPLSLGGAQVLPLRVPVFCRGQPSGPSGRCLHATAGWRVRATLCRDRPCCAGLPRLQAWFGAYATQSSTRCFGRPGSAIERRAILNPRLSCPLLCTSGIAPGAPESFCPHSRRDPAGVPQRRLSPPWLQRASRPPRARSSTGRMDSGCPPRASSHH